MGGHTVDVVEVRPVPAAVRVGSTTRAELATTIRRLLDDVWAFIRETGDLSPGHNVVVYRGDLEPGPAPVDVGVRVDRRFEGISATGVRCVDLPSGRAAHVTHRGPYDAMAPAYEALARWVREHGHAVAGPSWEVYGDWTADASQLETDIYVLLS